MERENPGSSIFTWLLIGVGGYFLYEWWKGQSVPTQTVSPGLPTGNTSQTNIGVPGTINTATGGTTTGSSPSAPVASLTAPLSAAWVTALTNGANWAWGTGKVPASASGFQWDFAANHAFGSTGHPTLSQMGIDGNSMMSLAQYAQASLNYIIKTSTSSSGFAGLGCAGCSNPNCSSCGMGSLDYSTMFYNKMLNKRGWAVGDFNTPFSGKNQGWLN